MAPSTVFYAAWAPFFSGAERALLVLLEHLDPSRYRPYVVVGTDGQLAEELRARRIEVAHLPLIYIGRSTLPQWAACVGLLARIVLRQRASLVHANDLPSFQPAGYVARFLRRPSLAHVRYVDNAQGFRWFLKPGFSTAVFVSESLRAEANAQVPDLFSGRSEVIYDGVRVDPLPDPAQRLTLRRELGLPVDRTLAVLSGQVSEGKGIWEFIEAAKVLAERRLPISFVVLGDDLRQKGKLRREAEQAVHDQGLTQSVHFLGFRPNAAGLMPAFDIVTMPSHVEPLGLSALEGMATGLPVVGSRVGGIAETVVDGETGLLIPSRNARALAGAIQTLATDKDKARTFGEAGRRRVESQFSVTAHAVRVQQLYDRMLDRDDRSRPAS